MDSNKLGMTRKFLNSQTTGNCAVSLFFFFFTLIVLFLLCVNIINFPLLLYVLSVFFLLDCWNYSFQPEHWAGLRMFLLKGTDGEVRCSSDATSISCIKCTKFHFSEHKGSQTGDCIYTGGSKPFQSQYFALTFSSALRVFEFYVLGSYPASSSVLAQHHSCSSRDLPCVGPMLLLSMKLRVRSLRLLQAFRCLPGPAVLPVSPTSTFRPTTACGMLGIMKAKQNCWWSKKFCGFK